MHGFAPMAGHRARRISPKGDVSGVGPLIKPQWAEARLLGSQSGTVETNPDGSTDIYFGPVAPDGKTNNWLQTVPDKGWWTILRLYNPLQPFFDKTWRPGEVEPVT